MTATTDRALGVAPGPIEEPAYWKWLQGLAASGPIVLVLESEVFACARSDDFGIEQLERVQESVLARWPSGARGSPP